jgi:hypothetical protein
MAGTIASPIGPADGRPAFTLGNETPTKPVDIPTRASTQLDPDRCGVANNDIEWVSRASSLQNRGMLILRDC